MFTSDEMQDLPEVISGPRFATYLRAQGNDVEKALELYLWNVETSAAFLGPLHFCEVGVRNGVVEAIEKVHGPNWPWSNGFIRSLPMPRNATHYDPGANLTAVARRQPTAGKVVADLNFAFWEKVFTVGQDQRLWIPHLHASFPGVDPATPASLARATAFTALETIRRFRNRIAHHEPVFTRNLACDLALIREMLRWRRPSAAQWLDRHEQVTALLARQP